MLLKTTELTDIALDWVVAKAEGYSPLYPNYPKGAMSHLSKVGEYSEYRWLVELKYSKSWSLAGPIIEREKITCEWTSAATWRACIEWLDEPTFEGFGPTPIVAAMRCYVASKLGDEVEVPDELVGGTT